MKSALLLLLFNAVHLAKPHCIITFNELHCRGTNVDGAVEQFYKKIPQIQNLSENFHLTVEHSMVSEVHYIPELPVKITKLIIRNSFLEIIREDALEEHQSIEEVDLSDNKLRNLLFVQYFPSCLKHLNLSKNNIGYIDNVFQKFENLLYLDLSSNNIGIFDITVVDKIPMINLSDNQISKIIPSSVSCNIDTINLSRNSLTLFNETYIRCLIGNVDLSGNKLKVLEVSNEKKAYNLSQNDIQQIQSTFNLITVFENLDLSGQLDNFKLNSTILVKNQLTMSNNQIPYLSNDTVNVRSMINSYESFPTIDISNSSILDITEYYFGNIKIPHLNLSHNSISTLRNKVFYASNINTLDLSYSKLKWIKSQAFANSKIHLLILTHNELQVIKDAFNDAKILEINLSFNNIKSVFSHSFEKVEGLSTLNLSNCQIDRIEAEAFIGANELKIIDLNNNQLHILEANTFYNLPITFLNLHGNNITVLRSKAFNNLYNMVEIILFNNSIQSVETNTFFDLPNTKTIDLRNNRITTIPPDLFYQIPNIVEVLLSGNNITQMNPFSNNLKLKYLTLSFNGTFKSKTIMNSNIQHLAITNSEIQILKHNSFDGLYNLIELYFTGSTIYSIESGALNHLYQLKYLDSINLFKHSEQLDKNTFKDLKSLEVLHFSSLSLNMLEPFCFAGLKNLKTLLLDYNQITELRKHTFYDLETLTFLDLSSNKIEIIEENVLVDLPSLEELYLTDNRLLNFVAQLPQLKILHLERNNISSLSKETFLAAGELEELHLNHNYLNQISVGVFQNLTNLKLLNMSYNEIKIIKNGELSNLKKLEQLDLSFNELVKVENESVFFSLRSMSALYLDNNHLKNIDFQKLTRNLPKMKYVGISLNKWKCDTLSAIIDALNSASVSYDPIIADFDGDNISGISCIDICNFVYCNQEEDGNFQFY